MRATIEQLVAEMSDRVEYITRREARNGVMPRFNQAKSIAGVAASFEVLADIPDNLKIGLFARAAKYPAYLRFANATETDDSKKDIRGLSIRVSDVPGDVLWGLPNTQDFLFNSYPALFATTPEEFLAFMRARQEEKQLAFFLNPRHPHLRSLMTVLRARKRHLSPLDIRYFSTVPFRFGTTDEHVVMYAVTPVSSRRTENAIAPGPNQLREALKSHLTIEPAMFEFGVQFQSDARRMPIEDASVIWEEGASPFRAVARISIAAQAVDTPEALARCEQMSFNPWQCLAEHEPLGRMNAVRREVYAHATRLRSAGLEDNVTETKPTSQVSTT